jgi:hypothetical protein
MFSTGYVPPRADFILLPTRHRFPLVPHLGENIPDRDQHVFVCEVNMWKSLSQDKRRVLGSMTYPANYDSCHTGSHRCGDHSVIRIYKYGIRRSDIALQAMVGLLLAKAMTTFFDVHGTSLPVAFISKVNAWIEMFSAWQG